MYAVYLVFLPVCISTPTQIILPDWKHHIIKNVAHSFYMIRIPKTGNFQGEGISVVVFHECPIFAANS